MENNLDRTSPIPLYFQLKRIIKEKIEFDELVPGDLIPTEKELAETYRISRPTVRQAIMELVNEGLLYREKGKGTFVSKPKINYGIIQKFITSYDDLINKGYQPKTKVLVKEIQFAKKPLAKKLGVKAGDKIIYLTRIRYIEGKPIVILINNIPYKYCPGLINEDLTHKSLYKTLSDKYNLSRYKANVTLEPIVASEFYAKLLQIDLAAPIHLMKSITHTKDHRIMDYFESYFRGDIGKMSIEIYNK